MTPRWKNIYVDKLIYADKLSGSIERRLIIGPIYILTYKGTFVEQKVEVPRQSSVMEAP